MRALAGANFQAVESWWLRLLIRRFWWLQIPLLGLDALVFSLSGTPGLKLVLILSPHVFVAVAAILSYRVFEAVPQTLSRLWARGVIVPRARRPEPTPRRAGDPYWGFRSVPRRRKRVAKYEEGSDQFEAFVENLQQRLNLKLPPVALGLVFAFLFYLFYPAASYPWGFPVNSDLHGTWKKWVLTPDLIIQAALVFVLGFIAWRLVVIASEVWHLGGDFDFHLVLRHPDKSAGLAPLGDLCFSLAAVWAVVAIYPTVWMVILLTAPVAKTGIYSLGHLFDGSNHIIDLVRQHQAQLVDVLHAARDPLFWLSWYVIGVFATTLALAIGTFFLPLYFVHRAMVRQHPSLFASLDELGRQIDGLALRVQEETRTLGHEVTDRAGGGEPAAKLDTDHLHRLEDLNGRLAAAQSVYAEESKLVPAWPFDAKVVAKLLAATVIPLSGLTTWVPRLVNKFIAGSK